MAKINKSNASKDLLPIEQDELSYEVESNDKPVGAVIHDDDDYDDPELSEDVEEIKPEKSPTKAKGKEKEESEKEAMARIAKRVTKTISTQYIETNTVGLDFALTMGKGLPLGDWITVVAEAGSGKSTIFADAVKRILTMKKALKEGFKVVYIDIENSRNLLVSMGLGEFILSGDLVHIPGRTTFKDLDYIYKSIILGTDPLYKGTKLVIIDSITAVISSKNSEADCEKDEFGNDAKALTKFLKKYIPLHEEKQITTVAICQVRTNMNQMGYGPAKKAAMVDAAKHFSTITMKLTKVVDSKLKDLNKVSINTVDGQVQTQEKFLVTLSTKGTDRKNRHGDIPDVKILVHYGKRVVNAYTLRNVLHARDFITGKNPNFKISKELPVEVPQGSLDLTEVNAFVTKNRGKIKGWLKEKGMYTPYIGKVSKPDGFEEE